MFLYYSRIPAALYINPKLFCKLLRIPKKYFHSAESNVRLAFQGNVKNKCVPITRIIISKEPFTVPVTEN